MLLGDNLKYKKKRVLVENVWPIMFEITKQTIFQYGPLHADFSDSERLPGSFRRSQFHPEHGITNGIRQHNVFVGNGCRGTEGGFFVCGGTGNYVKWSLYPRQLNSNFYWHNLKYKMFNLSLNSINPFMKLGFLFCYGMERRLLK